MCFVAGTLVRVNSSTPGAFLKNGAPYKKIEDINVGDTVLSYNELTQKQEYKSVTELFRHDVKLIFQLTYTNGTTIETTWNHPFYIQRGKPDASRAPPAKFWNVSYTDQTPDTNTPDWVEAKDIRVGDYSVQADGRLLQIASIVQDHRAEPVFNFEVDGNHTYYVSESGVLVHNYLPLLPVIAGAIAVGTFLFPDTCAGEAGDNCNTPTFTDALVQSGTSALFGVLGGKTLGKIWKKIGKSVPKKLEFDTKQIGKKWGAHKDEYPGMNSHNDYLRKAQKIYSDPKSVWSKGTGKYAGETHVRNGTDIMRLHPDGSFKSLYDTSIPSRLNK